MLMGLFVYIQPVKSKESKEASKEGSKEGSPQSNEENKENKEAPAVNGKYFKCIARKSGLWHVHTRKAVIIKSYDCLEDYQNLIKYFYTSQQKKFLG